MRNKNNPICEYCNKYKTLPGNGTIRPLCECNLSENQAVEKGEIKSPQEILAGKPNKEGRHFGQLPHYHHNIVVKAILEYHDQFPPPSREVDWEKIEKDFDEWEPNDDYIDVYSTGKAFDWFKSRPEFIPLPAHREVDIERMEKDFSLWKRHSIAMGDKIIVNWFAENFNKY